MVLFCLPPKAVIINKYSKKMDKDTAKDNAKVYEIGFHIAPIVSEENLAHEVQAIKALLEKAEASVIAEDFPRQKALAFPLSKMIGGGKKTFKEAYFGWIKFETEPESIVSFTKEVEKLSNILRFIVIKTARENTLHTPKFSSKYESKAKKGGAEGEKKQEVDEVEVDKAIDELVV